MKNSSHSNFSQQDLLSELVSGYTGNSSTAIREKKKTFQPNAQRMPVTTPIEVNLLVGKKIFFAVFGVGHNQDVRNK